MDGVAVSLVDERDSNWEEPCPRFRVYLHDSGGTSTGGPTATYDIVGADVLQVIDWAQRQAGDARTYSIALVRDRPGHGRGLVWLVGMDGNDSAADAREVAVQRRMLARRSTPVGVPAHDRMPADRPPEP